jgi:signal transduction histidine kinase
LALGFEALAIAGELLGVVPWRWAFHVLVAIKLLTNTLALVATRANRGVLEAHGINVLADGLVMTGAVYYTGAQTSPMFAIYVIEIASIAMLTNRSITLLMAGYVVALFASMALLVHTGVLTQYPSPIHDLPLSTQVVALGLVFQASVLLLPTLFTTSILRLLQRRERQLEERTRQLIEAGIEKSQLMANVTHELRTPIHGILSVSELCDSGVYGPITDKQKEAHAAIVHSAHTLLRLVDDLLLQAKSEAGKLEYEPSDVDLGELCATARAAIEWMLKTKSLAFELRIDEPITIQTDRGKLAQVLVNLLANAAKFTPDGGTVTLGAQRVDESSVRVWIEDTGIGIPDDERERIFEAFRQLEGGDVRRFGGIGLGLSLVRRLVALLGGTITVESTAGRGSTFALTLPVGGKSVARAAE